MGVLVTKTLVIAGEAGFFTTPNGQRGAMLRAYDKATGKEVGAVYMPAPQSGSPMTYTAERPAIHRGRDQRRRLQRRVASVQARRLEKTSRNMALLLVAKILFAAAFVFTGVAFACTLLIHSKVVKSNAMPMISPWRPWDKVRQAYRMEFPRSRMLFYRSTFLTLGLCSFIAMAVVLIVSAIKRKIHS